MEPYHNQGDYEIFLEPEIAVTLPFSPLEAELLGLEKSKTGKRFRICIRDMNPGKPIEIKYCPTKVPWEDVNTVKTCITPRAYNHLLSEGILFGFYALGKIIFIIRDNSQQV